MGRIRKALAVETIPHEFPRTHIHWTDEEDALLVGHYISGMTIHELAAELQRRPKEIRTRLEYFDLDLLKAHASF
jgi:hypothetical protein